MIYAAAIRLCHVRSFMEQNLAIVVINTELLVALYQRSLSVETQLTV